MANARDARDPQWIGDRLLLYRREHPSDVRTASQILDDFPLNLMGGAPDVDPGESTVQSTMREYREKMATQANEGDVHAFRTLCKIMGGTHAAQEEMRRTAHGLPRANDMAQDNHRAYVDDERDTRTITNSGLDRNGDAMSSAFNDPDPGDADVPKGGMCCPASYESMGAGLIPCNLYRGHKGLHSNGEYSW